ncbi:MAG: Undecaprenyl-diphosphatase [Bacteroidota bacterium]
MTIFEAILLAIVEGITEFLPISSTGHMIITSAMMGIKNDAFTKVFEVSIQFGAILSVVVIYFKHFFKDLNFYLKLFCAFLPTAVLGLLLGDVVDALLENVVVVAFTLLIGGILLLFVDRWFAKNESEGTEEVTYKSAFLIGFFQSLAMVPGVSRSAASIIGGLTQKITRKAAAEFSFFLAVPTMFAATAKKLYDFTKVQTDVDALMANINLLLIGNVVAFVVAMVAIKFFIHFLTKYGFKMFGYYRIVVGACILILLALGYDLKID